MTAQDEGQRFVAHLLVGESRTIFIAQRQEQAQEIIAVGLGCPPFADQILGDGSEFI